MLSVKLIFFAAAVSIVAGFWATVGAYAAKRAIAILHERKDPL